MKVTKGLRSQRFAVPSFHDGILALMDWGNIDDLYDEFYASRNVRADALRRDLETVGYDAERTLAELFLHLDSNTDINFSRSFA